MDSHKSPTWQFLLLISLLWPTYLHLSLLLVLWVASICSATCVPISRQPSSWTPGAMSAEAAPSLTSLCNTGIINLDTYKQEGEKRGVIIFPEMIIHGLVVGHELFVTGNVSEPTEVMELCLPLKKIASIHLQQHLDESLGDLWAHAVPMGPGRWEISHSLQIINSFKRKKTKLL